MADEGSRPDLGLTKSSSRTAKQINSKGLDEATRLRRHAAASALDEVLRALDRDLALLGSKAHLDAAFQPGLLRPFDAAKVACVHLVDVRLRVDEELLRRESSSYDRMLSDYTISLMAQGKSEDEVHALKDVYGEFPTPPTAPEEADRFFLRLEGKVRYHGDVVRRHVKRLQDLLANENPTCGAVNGRILRELAPQYEANEVAEMPLADLAALYSSKPAAGDPPGDGDSGLESLTPAAKTIDELEQDTPKLVENSGDWLKANDKRMRKEASVGSLKAMRNALTSGAKKTSDRLFGIDKTGRHWRKLSAETTTVYYWRETLKGEHPSPNDPAKR